MPSALGAECRRGFKEPLKTPAYSCQNCAQEIWREVTGMQPGFFDLEDRYALLEELGDPLP
ncbi:hypothetical protein, partial [Lentisalinibacter sediminis]|uniref:hypothetical protein n=1 Tax=Lentisalinibacter sediminis TaxID=2992237 RepID=UPI00386DF691